MRTRNSLLAVLLAWACGDDGGAASETGMTSGASTASPMTGDSSGAPMTMGPTSETAETTDGPGSETSETSETGPGGGGPMLLYSGPVEGGVVPDWSPDAPRALVMQASLGAGIWVVTLARIGADGSLSDNVTEQILVWGWETEPPVLYDGPVVGGSIPGWSADDPTPVVMAGVLEGEDSWTTTLASIGPDGSTSDNVADRIIVWGWQGAVPGAPSLLYSGPVMGGQIDGWDPMAPEPLVMMDRLAAADTWHATLASIDPGGGLRGNFADELLVWGW